jgi:uncharacterized membrane protein
MLNFRNSFFLLGTKQNAAVLVAMLYLGVSLPDASSGLHSFLFCELIYFLSLSVESNFLKIFVV